MNVFDESTYAPMRTSIGHSTVEQIWVRGYNLTEELMGEMDLGSMLFLMVSGRKPELGEARLFNSMLVALADHGLSPTAIAARVTYLGAPDSIQGAIAAGILGAGSVYLGVFEDVGRMLETVPRNPKATDEELSDRARQIVEPYLTNGKKIPGLGHPIHRNGDPRTARLKQLAEEEDLFGPNFRLMLHIREQASEAFGKNLVLNATGACGAVMTDLGFDGPILRGFAVVARAAGLVGHLQEEMDQPIGQTIWQMIENKSSYEAPR